MTNKTISLNSSTYHYMLENSLHETPLLAELRAETAKLSYGKSQISPDQGQFMAWLLKIANMKRVLEIGTFTGYSALVMANALPNDGQLVTCDINNEWTAIAKDYWQRANVNHKIELRLAPALETLSQLLIDKGESYFDFAFIDADKKNYLNYYEACLTLVRKGGIIAIDNVLWSGQVADLSVTDKITISLRQFNKMIYEDKRVEICMIPIGDGLTLARKL